MINYPVKFILLGGLIRAFFSMNYQFGVILEQRIEIATPLNSLKRAMEGIDLLQRGINPYTGDIVHDIPLILWLIKYANVLLKKFLPFFYIFIDMTTALILYKSSLLFVNNKLNEKSVNSKWKSSNKVQNTASNPDADTEDLQYQNSDLQLIPQAVLLTYLFNPLSIVNCAGLTSTVFSNVLLALVLYSLITKQYLLLLICISIESLRNLYPVMLLAPACLIFCKSLRHMLGILITFVTICYGIYWLNGKLLNDNSLTFLNGTLKFIAFYGDLQPNIGLFWYFFTEMFEHFRTMFLITFQMNASILYILPLSFKLRNEPILLATTLFGLMTIFKAYPCLGDVSFYLSLLPLWRRSWKFMAHNFIVFCFFIISLFLLPALWHLWIYAGSANANFYFGATLVFSTGQIFLITDLLYAQMKREFCLSHGQQFLINDEHAKIVLD